MHIDINKLIIEFDIYNKLLDEYEEVYYNFYNELNQIQDFWQSNHANYFFYNIDEEKVRIKIFLTELNELKKVYSFILDKYKKYGKKIFVDLNNKDYVFKKIDKYLLKLNELTNFYINLNANFDEQIKHILLEQQKKIESNKKQINIFKDKYNKYFRNIEEIEKQIKEKILKISFEEIKENTTQTKSFGAPVNSYMDTKQIEISLKKLKFYKREEDIIFEKIKSNLIDIIAIYNFRSKENLEKLELEINNKFRIISNNHENEIIILTNKMNDVIKTNNEVNQILWDAMSELKRGVE